MGEYISREAVEQVLRGIANGLSVGETEALKAKGLKALYKIQGAKEILNSVDNDLCFIPAADVQPIYYAENVQNEVLNYLFNKEREAESMPYGDKRQERIATIREIIRFVEDIDPRMDGDTDA